MTIEDKGEETKTNEKSNTLIKKYEYIGKNTSPDFMNQIEVFKKLVDERKDEIFSLGRKVNYDNLVFNYKDRNKSGKSFNNFTEAIILFEKIKKVIWS